MEESEDSVREPRERFSAERIRAAAAPQSVPYTPRVEAPHTPWWQKLLKAAAWVTWFVGPAAPPPSTLEDMQKQKQQKKKR